MTPSSKYCNSSKLTTHSGYLKSDVYSELTKSMIDKDVQKSCDLLLELLNTRGEGDNVTCHLITFICSYVFVPNAFLYEKTVQRFEECSVMPKRNLHTNTAFHKNILEILVMILSVKIKPVTFVKNGQTDMGIVEQYLYNYSDKEYKSLVQYKTEGSITSDLYLGFNILWNRIRHNDRKGVTIIIQYLTATVRSQVDPIAFNEIEHLKPFLRMDIVWYVWQVLSTYAKKDKNDNPFISPLLYLFAHKYQKKERVRRLNLLQMAAVLITEKVTTYKEFCIPAIDIIAPRLVSPIDIQHNMHVLAEDEQEYEYEHEYEQDTCEHNAVNQCNQGNQGNLKQPKANVKAAIVKAASVKAQTVKPTKSLDYLKILTYIQDD